MCNEQAESSGELELITAHLYTNLCNTQHRQPEFILSVMVICRYKKPYKIKKKEKHERNTEGIKDSVEKPTKSGF